MNVYEVDVVNPKTNEQRQVTVTLTELQHARAKQSACWVTQVQQIARPLIPEGFMPVGNRVRAVTLQ